MGRNLTVNDIGDMFSKIINVQHVMYKEISKMAGELVNLQNLVSQVVTEIGRANQNIQNLEAKLATAQNDSVQLQALIDQLTPNLQALQTANNGVPA